MLLCEFAFLYIVHQNTRVLLSLTRMKGEAVYFHQDMIYLEATFPEDCQEI